MNGFLGMQSLVQLVVKRLSQVSGIGVQTYAEDRIQDMIQHKFETLVKEDWWPWLMSWQSFTLDGSTGTSTTTVSDYARDHGDLRVLYAGDKRRPLTRLPTTINPYVLSGTTPVHFEFINDADKLFRIWPLTSTGSIRAHCRLIPTRYTSDAASVAFDAEALILGATADYLADDGTNPDATNKFEVYFEQRVAQLKKDVISQPFALDDHNGTAEIVDEWYESII